MFVACVGAATVLLLQQAVLFVILAFKCQHSEGILSFTIHYDRHTFISLFFSEYIRYQSLQM